MQVNLFNSKNPNGKRVSVSINIEHVDITKTKDGELIYLVTLTTGARKPNGQRIDIININDVTESTLKREISLALSTIAEQIDWGSLEEDSYPPSIVSMSPMPGEKNVSIDRDVFLEIKDPFPASFIDSSTLSVKVNDIDVTSEVNIVEKENRLFLHWIPKRIKS